MRLAAIAKFVVIVALALRLHHHLHGPTVDYVGLALAAGASWVGVPGPGEPVLIAAAVFAARHSLDIGGVIAIAWLAATVGGIAGWVIGTKAGRAVLTTRGPLNGMRRRALARGDDVFARHPVAGVMLTPSWIAGIHRVRASVFLVTNAAAAALWAVGIGLGAYFIGPTIVDVVSDLGLVTGIGLVALILVAVGAEVLRRRRRRREGAGTDATAESQTTRPS